MTIEVTDAPEAKRFEARVDGKLAGFIQYEARHDAVVLAFLDGPWPGGTLCSMVSRLFRFEQLATGPDCMVWVRLETR